MRYIKWRLLGRKPKDIISDFNKISGIGAILVAVGALNLISYVLGGRHKFGELISSLLFDLPVPAACTLLILAGGVTMGFGYGLDLYDKKRLLKYNRDKRIE